MNSTLSGSKFLEESFTHVIAKVAYAFHCLENLSPLPIELLLLFVPFFAGFLNVIYPMLSAIMLEKSANWKKMVVRNITSVSSAGYRLVGIPTDRNAFLQNAVLMYIQNCTWKEKPLSTKVWRNISSNILLLDPFRSRVYESQASPFHIESSEEDEEDISTRGPSRSLKLLNRLILVKLPTSGCFVPVQYGNIELSYSRRRIAVANAPAIERSIILRAYGRNAANSIDEFIQRSLSYFITQLPRISKNSRSFFDLQPPSSSLFESNSTPTFKRYPLNDEKNFDTLFFPEREKVLKLVDDFLFRRGRFMVEGFPYKLGFLIHGPSGTGKTSFVKALAAYTGRNVVSVPLHLVKTNQQLFDIFLNRVYTCVGESEKVSLSLEEIIFLLDDVDASAPLVASRIKQRTVQKRAPAKLSASDFGKVELEAETDDSDISGDENSKTVEEVVSLKENGTADSMLNKLLNLLPESKDGGMNGIKDMGLGSDLPLAIDTKKSLINILEDSDKLDLSGLLNVLDGVVDTPGRIIVMSTSHPEKLDPALVRPGRMSTKLRLDNIRLPALMKILGLHFGDVPPPEDQQVSDILTIIEEEIKSQRSTEKSNNIRYKTSEMYTEQVFLEKGDSAYSFDGNSLEDKLKSEPAQSGGRKEKELENSKDDTETIATEVNHLDVPMGVAVARLQHRELSSEQKKKVADFIAVLEKELIEKNSLDEKKHLEATKDVGKENSSLTNDANPQTLTISPAQVERMCAECETLDEFLRMLKKYFL